MEIVRLTLNNRKLLIPFAGAHVKQEDIPVQRSLGARPVVSKIPAVWGKAHAHREALL